jgi:HlyD family secretion protein
MNKITLISISLMALVSCNSGKAKYDASGTFEADEIIVSAEATGKILQLDFEEGDTLAKNDAVGSIDVLGLELQKGQIEASLQAIGQKTNDAEPQVAILKAQSKTQKAQIEVLQQQIEVAEKERVRLGKLVKADAATPKQLDDAIGQIAVLQKQLNTAKEQLGVLEQQIASTRASVNLQNRGILSEKPGIQKRVEQVNDQIARGQIKNPAAGIVLAKYAMAGEFATLGKPLYKIADMSEMTLRAYITGAQLSSVKTGQNVKVLVDDGPDKLKELPGTVTWISNKAEFTPKTIQTKDERANLVYALKIKVKNDGTLKIGMYGEVLL